MKSKDKLQWKFLWYCYDGKIKKVEPILKENLIDVNNISYIGETPLTMAISGGSFTVCKLLIEYGADVNLTPKYSPSPMRLAISMQNPIIVKLLLENKASIILGKNGDLQHASKVYAKYATAQSQNIAEMIWECTKNHPPSDKPDDIDLAGLDNFTL